MSPPRLFSLIAHGHGLPTTFKARPACFIECIRRSVPHAWPTEGAGSEANHVAAAECGQVREGVERHRTDSLASFFISCCMLRQGAWTDSFDSFILFFTYICVLCTRFLHKNNVWHRDIKSANVLCHIGHGRQRSVKLCDFVSDRLRQFENNSIHQLY